MKRTLFKVSKMDCPSEENLIRMKLGALEDVTELEFDIPKRSLSVFHNGNPDDIEHALASLNLGELRIRTEEADPSEISSDSQQRLVLWTVLAINLAFFIIEMLTGLVSWSMGLIADSLDMLADSIVYGLSLFAVGGTILLKKRIARTAGYFQIGLAAIGLMEVIRRFIGVAELPDFRTMIFVSALALIANGVCLVLLQRSRSTEAHMKASMIFTSNDIVINLGVIMAGVLVNWTVSNKPDLIVGLIVFGVVMQGAMRILKLGN